MLHPLAQYDEGSGISSVMLASDDVFDVVREEWLAEQEVAESSAPGIGPAYGALFKARPAILCKPRAIGLRLECYAGRLSAPGLRSWHTSQLLKDRNSEETDPRVELRVAIQTLLFLEEIAVIIPLSKRNPERSSHSPLPPSSSTLHWCPVLAP